MFHNSEIKVIEVMKINILWTSNSLSRPNPGRMDVFSYPHREGARMTMEIVLAWMDEGEDPGVDMVLIVTNEQSFLKNMKTVYRESEDQFPGVDRTREYRKGKFQ